MEGSNLNLSALKGKIFEKLSGAKEKSSDVSGKKTSKSAKKNKKENPKSTKQEKPKNTNNSTEKPKSNTQTKKEMKDKPSKQIQKEPASSNGDDDVLRREALSLGATEEDLKLVQGVDDSDGEEFGGATKDKSLASDVSSFVSSLGLSGKLDIVADDDVSASEDETEDSKAPQPKKEESKKTKDTQKEETKNARKLEKKEAQKEAKKEEKRKRREEKEAEQMDVEEEKVDSEKPQTALAERKKTTDKVGNHQSVNPENFRIETRVDWYNCDVPKVTNPEKCDRFAVERLMDKAKALIDSENRLYLQEFTSNNSQKKFLSQILSDGTLNDKISALTLLVQEAPFHNLKAFDTLLGYCEKKSRTAALQAINAMKDLLLNGLLPDRKLLAFNKQALSSDASEETLALYYFEDHLKKSYFKFIQILEYLSHDPILHVKMNVVTHIFDLLKGKPEQEANLLRLGVNKLGDIENKVSSKTSYLLLQLEEAHPAMKKIITDAVTDLIFQKKNEHHAQYYTILTLNQTVFQSKDAELANSLVKTYFSLFEKILIESDSASGEVDKLGGDRILGKSEKGRKNNKKAFKKGKKGGRSIKVEEKTESEVVEEKNAKMFSALLTGLNRALPFANLSSETYLVHLNTLYKITHSTHFNTSVQALILVHQIVTQQDLDSDRYYRTLYESLMDPRLVTSSKQGIYLNLLFKSLKKDINNVPRILAFVKRMLQICSHWINIGSITGMFYLLMELSKTHPQILELMEPLEARPEMAGSEEGTGEYDPKKRDPKFANGQRSCFWEMTQFTNHYHPTVAIYATSLLEGTPQPKPDLGMYTLAHFLDKFVYRNAKQKAVTRGSSIMQPLGGAHLNSLLVRASNVQSGELPANTVDWLSRRAETIRPDEKFFYNYFTRNKNKIRSAKGADETGEGDDGEDRAETEIWDALVKSKPDLENSDDDSGFSDFDDEDMGDISDDEQSLGDLAVGELADQLDDEDDFDDEEGPELDGSEGEDAEIFDFNSEDELASDDDANIADGKRRRDDDDENGKMKKKKKLSSLPTFASAEDYAHYLQSDDEM